MQNSFIIIRILPIFLSEQHPVKVCWLQGMKSSQECFMLIISYSISPFQSGRSGEAIHPRPCPTAIEIGQVMVQPIPVNHFPAQFWPKWLFLGVFDVELEKMLASGVLELKYWGMAACKPISYHMGKSFYLGREWSLHTDTGFGKVADEQVVEIMTLFSLWA